MVAGIAANHVHRIRLKQILQREHAVRRRQIFRRRGRNFQKRVVRRARHVVLNLRDQRRNKVEGLVNVGKLIQQFDHAVIIFESMQPHPGQTILPRDQVFVKRLMLVPQNDDAQNGH